MRRILKEYRAFDRDRKTLRPRGKSPLKTVEGKNAWSKAYRKVRKQKARSALQWSDGLAKAAGDHCVDASGSINDKIKKYGKATGMKESIARSPIDRTITD